MHTHPHAHAYTLKDFKIAKIGIHNIYYFFNVSILLKFGKNEHQYVSKTCFKIYGRMIKKFRATVFQIAIPYDSKTEI